MKRFTTLCSMMLLPIASMNAQWALVDDFNSEDTSHITLKSLSTSALIWIGQPEETDDNTAIYVFSGDAGQSYGDTWASMPLPGSIGTGQKGTVFWRARQEGISNNWHISLTHVPESGAWDQHAPIARFSTGGRFEVRDGSAYVPITPEFRPELSTWYHYWMVADYNTQSFQLFVQGPEDSEPRQLFIGGDNPKADIAFRAIPTGPLAYVIISTNSDNPNSPNLGDLFFIDDLYFASGVNLTNPLGGDVDPVEPTFGPYPIVDGDAATGTWMGDLYVETSPWLWSYDFGTWLYSADAEPAPTVPGLWAYVFRSELPEPAAEGWGGYEELAPGWVDTGSWLGLLYVTPEGWAYSFVLESWVYAFDPGATEAGAWIYFYSNF